MKSSKRLMGYTMPCDEDESSASFGLNITSVNCETEYAEFVANSNNTYHQYCTT